EADSPGGQLSAIKPGRPQQSPHPNVACLCQHLETVSDENAILAPQRRDVGYRRQGDQIQHCPDKILVGAELLRERHRQLEGDTDRSQILVWITAARALGIQHCYAIRKLATWQVMVG